jgi:hypothetical protein
MAARVPLPKVGSLPEVVLFHREDPRDPTVVLQIPNEDRTDAATYMLDLENMGDVGWLEGLPNPKELRNALDMEMHIAYCPQTGHFKAIEDLDAPTPVQGFLEKARREGAYAGNSIIDRLWTRARLGRRAPIESPLRQALAGRRAPGGLSR